MSPLLACWETLNCLFNKGWAAAWKEKDIVNFTLWAQRKEVNAITTICQYCARHLVCIEGVLLTPLLFLQKTKLRLREVVQDSFSDRNPGLNKNICSLKYLKSLREVGLQLSMDRGSSQKVSWLSISCFGFPLCCHLPYTQDRLSFLVTGGDHKLLVSCFWPSNPSG
jgi:hypothetical protein